MEEILQWETYTELKMKSCRNNKNIGSMHYPYKSNHIIWSWRGLIIIIKRSIRSTKEISKKRKKKGFFSKETFVQVRTGENERVEIGVDDVGLTLKDEMIGGLEEYERIDHSNFDGLMERQTVDHFYNRSILIKIIKFKNLFFTNWMKKDFLSNDVCD
jgi:hypothetical protein